MMGFRTILFIGKGGSMATFISKGNIKTKRLPLSAVRFVHSTSPEIQRPFSRHSPSNSHRNEKINKIKRWGGTTPLTAPCAHTPAVEC